MPLCGSQGSGNTFVAGNHVARRSSGEFHRLQSRNDGFGLVLRVIPRHAGFPAQAIVQDQIRRDAPAVLRKKSVVLTARIENLRAGLGKRIRRTNEKVREIDAGLAAVESITAIFVSVIALVNLVIVKLPAELDRVRSDYARKIVQDLIRVVVLPRAHDRQSNVEIVESEGRHTYQAGRRGADPTGIGPRSVEPQLAQSVI